MITRVQNEFKSITLSSLDALDFTNEIIRLLGWLRGGIGSSPQDRLSEPVSRTVGFMLLSRG